MLSWYRGIWMIMQSIGLSLVQSRQFGNTHPIGSDYRVRLSLAHINHVGINAILLIWCLSTSRKWNADNVYIYGVVMSKGEEWKAAYAIYEIEWKKKDISSSFYDASAFISKHYISVTLVRSMQKNRREVNVINNWIKNNVISTTPTRNKNIQNFL